MRNANPNRPIGLIALILVQALAATFFLWDVLEDAGPDGLRTLANIHIAIETMAAIGLIAAVIFETRYLIALLRRKTHLEHQVSIAAGAFNEVLLLHFDQWGLTPAERDVAIFTIKGFSIAEVAVLRGSAEGTIKSQLNAVYRKAGVSGRGALLGLLVDDLIATPLITPDVSKAGRSAA
jgi:DNA-binding CsgD family transcriptional regulator